MLSLLFFVLDIFYYFIWVIVPFLVGHCEKKIFQLSVINLVKRNRKLKAFMRSFTLTFFHEFEFKYSRPFLTTEKTITPSQSQQICTPQFWQKLRECCRMLSTFWILTQLFLPDAGGTAEICVSFINFKWTSAENKVSFSLSLLEQTRHFVNSKIRDFIAK